MTVNIHGKQYVTVAERVTQAHDALKGELSITTEVLQHEPTVVVKATVQIGENIFTGTSAANPSKAIEKQSPYEVAETSAVGRALGFAGFGLAEGIATADEVVKATAKPKKPNKKEAYDIAYDLISDAQTEEELRKLQSKLQLSTILSSEQVTELWALADEKLESLKQ